MKASDSLHPVRSIGDLIQFMALWEQWDIDFKLSHRDETTSFIENENTIASDTWGTGQNVLVEVGQPALAHHIIL